MIFISASLKAKSVLPARLRRERAALRDEVSQVLDDRVRRSLVVVIRAAQLGHEPRRDEGVVGMVQVAIDGAVDLLRELRESVRLYLFRRGALAFGTAGAVSAMKSSIAVYSGLMSELRT